MAVAVIIVIEANCSIILFRLMDNFFRHEDIMKILKYYIKI